MSPFSVRIALEDVHLGIPVNPPALVTRRLLDQAGMIDAETPLLWIRMGSHDYELRIRFPCYLTVHALEGESLDRGALLAYGGADGENLPEGFRYLSAHLLPDPLETK